MLLAVGILIDDLNLPRCLTGVHRNRAVIVGDRLAGGVGGGVPVHPDGGGAAVCRRGKGGDGQGRSGQQTHGENPGGKFYVVHWYLPPF